MEILRGRKEGPVPGVDGPTSTAAAAAMELSGAELKLRPTLQP
jgi:hypothetical protein